MLRNGGGRDRARSAPHPEADGLEAPELREPVRDLERIAGVTPQLVEAAAARLRSKPPGNLISVTRAIARRTRRGSSSLDEFGEQFSARLDALARADGLLSWLRDGERIAFDEFLQVERARHRCRG